MLNFKNDHFISCLCIKKGREVLKKVNCSVNRNLLVHTKMNASDYPEHTLARRIWIVFSPVLILCGTFGNCLSIYVLNQRHRHRTSTSTYLSALALCDLLVLYIGLLRQWVSERLRFDIRHVNDTLCKIHFFLVNFLLQLSSWILVAITIERVNCVRRPHKAKVGCTRQLSIAVLLGECLFLLTMNGHILFGVKIRIHKNNNDTFTNSGQSSCEHDNTDDGYSNFMYYIWTWIDFGVVFVLPFLILMTGNIIIIINIKRSRRFQREVITRTPRLKAGFIQKPLMPMTAMLLTLNSVFFVCVGPVNVFSIGQFHWWPQDTEGHTLAIQTVLWAVVNILMYTNNAVNFLLYFLCSFRKEIKKVLYVRCRTYRRKRSSLGRSRKPTRLQSVYTSIKLSCI